MALQPNVATGQTLSFGSMLNGVSSVLFEVEAVESSTTWTGLAEVAFDDTIITSAVPVGASLPLLATGLAAFAAVRRRT